MHMDDMFGHVPQKGELAIGLPDAPARTGPIVNTPDTIRAMFTGYIDELRASTDRVPWTPRLLHSNRGMAKWWAEWLKHGEGDRLLAEFRAELLRLGVDPMNPADGSPSYEYEP